MCVCVCVCVCVAREAVQCNSSGNILVNGLPNKSSCTVNCQSCITPLKSGEEAASNQVRPSYRNRT